MENPSRARLFFDEVMGKRENAFSFLVSLLSAGIHAAENGWRDYKEAEFLGKTPNSDQEKERIKRTWSENLSAFANTAGGVLIWGFHTSGPVPDKLSLAPDCAQLADLLRSLINDATDPYVAGVEIEAIRNPQDAKAGIVLCFIPASSFAPHQASWGERTYFIRAQDANLPCPQPLLRAMFYPRVQARLEPTVRMTVNDQRGGIKIALEARIRCLGPATAEVALIQIEPREFYVENVSFDNQWEQIGTNLVKYRHPIPPNFVPPHLMRVNGLLLSNGASIVFRFFTHNTPAHHALITFTQDEVLNCSRTNAPLERQAPSSPIFP
jgi:hypothetical protein